MRPYCRYARSESKRKNYTDMNNLLKSKMANSEQVRSAKVIHENLTFNLEKTILNWILRIPLLAVIFLSLESMYALLRVALSVDHSIWSSPGWSTPMMSQSLWFGMAFGFFLMSFSHNRAPRTLGIVAGVFALLVEI